MTPRRTGTSASPGPAFHFTGRGTAMKTRIGAGLLAVALAALLPPSDSRRAGAQTPAGDGKARAEEVFGLTKTWQFHLQIAAQEWKKMQPVGGMRFPGGPPGFGGPKKAPEKPAEKPAEQPTDVH